MLFRSDSVAAVAKDMHEHVAGFPAYSALDAAPGTTRALGGSTAFTAKTQPVAAPV